MDHLRSHKVPKTTITDVGTALPGSPSIVHSFVITRPTTQEPLLPQSKLHANIVALQQQLQAYRLMDRHVHSNCSFFGILFHVHSNNTWYRKTCNRAWLFQRYLSLSWRRRIPFHRTSKQLLTGHSRSWIGEKDSNNRYASLKWSILQNNLLTWICRTATNQKASPRTRRYIFKEVESL